MSETFRRIQNLIKKGEIKISSHGYDELAEDHIYIRDMLSSIHDAHVVEDYPHFGKGPCTMVLQFDRESRPVHSIWGHAKGT